MTSHDQCYDCPRASEANPKNQLGTYIDALVLDCSISNALAMVISQSYTEPSIS